MKGNDNMKNIGKTKKILSFVLAVVMMLCVAPIGKIDANAASWSSDYRNWSQAASDIGGMRSYGCWVVAQAKMIYEANINRESSFNPDTYYWWQKNNGYIDNNFYQTNGGYAPVAYANQRGKNLEYLGYWTATDNQLWFNINAGYYTIVYVGNHYVLLANDLSKQYGKLYCYDSWNNYTPSSPQPLTRYANHYGGYVYKANNSSPADIGNDFYAYIIKNDTWRHIENNNGNVQIASNGNNSVDPRQIWHFVRTDDIYAGAYKIINEYDGTVLNVDNGGKTNGTNITSWNSLNNDFQRWYLYWNDGTFTIKSPATNLYVDVLSDSSAPGTNVQLWEQNGSLAQSFSIYDITRDGWNYSKPAIPDKTRLSSANATGNNVTLKWSESILKSSKLDERTYTIKLWKGDSATGIPYKTISNVKGTSYTLSLDYGKYRIQINSNNIKYANYTAAGIIDELIFEKPIEHTRSYTSKITTAATCTESGIKTFTCSCGDKYTEKIPALGHVDSNNDGQCDRCGVKTGTPNTPDTPSQNCSHLCHRGGFFWAIIRFFCKLFGTNKYCTCGAAHY